MVETNSVEDLYNKILSTTAKELFIEAKRALDRADMKTKELEEELSIAREYLNRFELVTQASDKTFLVDLDGTVFQFDLGADYTVPGYFRNRPIQQGVVDVITNLHKAGNKIKIITAAINEQAAKDKAAQSKEVFPFLKDEDVIIVPYGMKKTDFIPKGYKYILIDDYTPNLRDAAEAGIEPVKVFNGINGTKGTYRKDFPYGKSFNINDKPEDVIICII